jgi:hypothetical protein
MDMAQVALPCNSHLLFRTRTDDVVDLTQAAVVIHPDLGNDENGNAFGPRRCPFDTRQHGVDDVLGEVVFSVGDVDLVAGDGIGAVIQASGGGGQGADVRSGLGLGEVHGTAPLAGVEFFQEHLLLLVGAEQFDHLAGAVAFQA